MTELSPAAEAVLAAVVDISESPQAEAIAAATLRAMTDWFHSFDTAKECYQKMHAVADELEERAEEASDTLLALFADLHSPGPE